MRELISRFAAVVIAKLRRLVMSYTVVERDESMESWTEGVARHALVWLLAWVTDRFDHFPWLRPQTRNYVTEEFDRIVTHLRNDWGLA